jgi:uncharacterized membrane protein YgcG
MAMKDPLLIDAWKTEIAPDQRRHYHQDELTNEELRKGLNEAHDRIRKLTSANNQLVGRQAKVQQTRKWERLWTRILTAAVVSAWAVILLLLKYVLEHLK